MAAKKNDPVKPKKDNWGRSPGDKYYNFNPKTKRYEDPKNVYKYPKEGYGKVDYNPLTSSRGIGAQISDINSARAKDSMQQQNAYYGRPKNVGMKQAQQDANERSGMTKLGVLRMTPNAAPKKKYKTGGMTNPNAKVSASKVATGRPTKSAEPKSAAKKATGKVGGISKSPKTAIPKAKYGMVMRRK